MVDAYHDNKEERLYVTSQVVGRFRVDRVVTDGNPFFVAETSQAQVPLLLLTLIASVLSGKVENKPW